MAQARVELTRGSMAGSEATDFSDLHALRERLRHLQTRLRTLKQEGLVLSRWPVYARFSALRNHRD